MMVQYMYIHTYIYTHTHIYIYIYIYAFVKKINEKIQKTYSLLKQKVYSLRTEYTYNLEKILSKLVMISEKETP